MSKPARHPTDRDYVLDPSPAASAETEDEALTLLAEVFGAEAIHDELDGAAFRARVQMARRFDALKGLVLADVPAVAKELHHLRRIAITRREHEARAERIALLGAPRPARADPEAAETVGSAMAAVAEPGDVVEDEAVEHVVPAATRAARKTMAAAARAAEAAAHPLAAPPAMPEDGPARSAERAPTAEEEAHAVLVAARGDEALDRLPAAAQFLLGVHREREAAAGGTITVLRITTSGFSTNSFRPAPNRSLHEPHDLWLTKACDAFELRDDAREAIARLEGNGDRLRAARAEAVSAAIAKAGGADRVAKGMAEARTIRRAYREHHPDAPRLAALEARRDDLLSQLKALGMSAEQAWAEPADTLGRAVADELAPLAAQIDELAARIGAEAADNVAIIVARAVAGDEPSRAGIEHVARDVPMAFRPGLADDLAAARPERGVAGVTIVAMLVDAVERGIVR